MLLDLFRTVYDYPGRRESELREIAAAHRPVRFERESFILREGERAHAYYLLETGLVRAFVSDYTGREITTDFFQPGEVLIEVSSLFQRIPTRTNLQTLTEVSGYGIDFDVFQELFHRIEGFREWGRAWMSGQLFRERQRRIDMLTLSATDRYRTLVDTQPEVLAQAPLKHVASYLGVTDSSLSRIRKEISRKA
ncbi:Crp/Fnr family transcriptional regulator [Lewinella sp. IMCC34191]|uniref:Crp/Fnr family transcriptional regulator n=1 Tax=Lewinella sp. IMCC34191 TaxID=2259172 RepID=UPI0018E568FF|nr:Crp/Fnr family transcriptional regulator [Lewinella sp. IMCC34191]